MPYEISWLVEGQVIFARLSGVLTDQDAHHYDEHMRYYLNWGSVPLVHVVVDCRKVQELPHFQSLAHMQFIHHPRLGWSVSAGSRGNKVVHMLMSMLSQIGRGRLRQMDEIGEALNFLRELDPSLPDLHTALRELYQQGIRRTHDVMTLHNADF